MNTTQEKRDFKREFKKRCFRFSLKILELSESLRNNRTNWPLLDQIVRSGTSIGANVVEGGNITSKREFINYFNIALKSTSETLYWLALIKEINQKEMDKIEKIYKECEELKRLLSTIILNTKNNSKI